MAPRQTYLPPRVKARPASAGMLTLIAVGAMIGLLPLSQYLAGYKPEDQTVREVDIALPPPPPPPEREPPPEQEPPPQDSPQLETPPPQMMLGDLNVTIEAGTGNALASGFNFDSYEMDSAEVVEQIQFFSLSELDEVPRMIQPGTQRHPPASQRPDWKEVLVVLDVRIDRNGRPQVVGVDSTTHRIYNEYAIQLFETSKWSVPKKDGEPAGAFFKFPYGGVRYRH